LFPDSKERPQGIVDGFRVRKLLEQHRIDDDYVLSLGEEVGVFAAYRSAGLRDGLCRTGAFAEVNLGARSEWVDLR
jgi:hypothetical protein